jgi:hypothetical protein
VSCPESLLLRAISCRTGSHFPIAADLAYSVISGFHLRNISAAISPPLVGSNEAETIQGAKTEPLCLLQGDLFGHCCQKSDVLADDELLKVMGEDV